MSYSTSEELNEQLLDAEEAQDSSEVFKLEALITVQRGEFDFPVPSNVNELFPDIEPIKLRNWLHNVWKGKQMQK